MRLARDERLRLLRKKVDELSAPERLHDDDRDAPLGRGEKPFSPSLGVLVHVVVLDLAEVPVVGGEHLEEHVRVAVEAEADVADLAGGLLARDPVADAELLELVPRDDVREHVHEVVVHVVRPEAAELLVEVAVDGRRAADEVLRELRGDVHAVADAVLLEDAAKQLLASRVDVGGVEVVDAQLDGAHDLALRRGVVDGGAGAGRALEAHAPKAKERERLAVSVVAILHANPRRRYVRGPRTAARYGKYSGRCEKCARSRPQRTRRGTLLHMRPTNGRHAMPKSILIKDTTREERIEIVRRGLDWCGDGSCEQCSGCSMGVGSIDAMYLPYIEGELELAEVNMRHAADHYTLA